MLEQLTAIQALLNQYQNDRPGIKFQIFPFTSPELLADGLKTGRRFDLYLLDIIMPKLDGITLAQQIRALDTETTVVFLTQSEDYALEAYRVYAKQYIVKPVKKEDLYLTLDKFVARIKSGDDKFYTLSAPGRTVNLLYSSIMVIEYIGRALRFHLTTGEYIESKTIRTAFGVAVAEILQDRRFLTVHQSFVINMAHVRELHNRCIYMNNNIEIPIPRPKYVMVKNAYLAYLAEIKGE
jgi:DNA-binding LytR/AlgR family response regulator